MLFDIGGSVISVCASSDIGWGLVRSRRPPERLKNSNHERRLLTHHHFAAAARCARETKDMLVLHSIFGIKLPSFAHSQNRFS